MASKLTDYLWRELIVFEDVTGDYDEVGAHRRRFLVQRLRHDGRSRISRLGVTGESDASCRAASRRCAGIIYPPAGAWLSARSGCRSARDKARDSPAGPGAVHRQGNIPPALPGAGHRYSPYLSAPYG